VTDRRVHFIYLGGDFLWQHARAVTTARVHEAPITVWCTQEPDGEEWAALDGSVDVRELLDCRGYLKHPIGLANVKDLAAWNILHEHGGLYLDLDTISLKPCWDLLTREGVSTYVARLCYAEGRRKRAGARREPPPA
jgi:hypothetical protein